MTAPPRRQGSLRLRRTPLPAPSAPWANAAGRDSLCRIFLILFKRFGGRGRSEMSSSRKAGPARSWAADIRRRGLSPSFADALDTALESGLSRFPHPLTARPDAHDARDVVYSPSLIAIPMFKLPPARPGTSVSAPLVVRNQRTEGSCTGQALAAVIDIQNLRRLRQGADVPRRVSARMLYASAQAFDAFPDDDLPGSSLRGALKGFWNRGVCDDDVMPYLPGWRNDALTVAVARDARRVSLGAYMRLRHLLDDYHSALSDADAILVSAMVHDGWAGAKVKRNRGVIPLGRRPVLAGAHAFAIVGFTPQGFLVLNSWGAGWGHYDVQAALAAGIAARADRRDGVVDAALRNLEEAGIGAGGLPGIALWTYQDWQRHVLDAWVLRLAAPTRLPSGVTGGYLSPAAAPGAASRPATVREAEVVGHLIHFSGAGLIRRGVHATPEATLLETARFLEEDAKAERYEHVLLDVSGAFETRDGVLARAAAAIPVYKRNGIYPFFLLGHSNLSAVIPDLLSALAPRVLAAAGAAFTDVADIRFERMSAPVGAALWSNVKATARAAFAEGAQVRGALERLLAAAAAGRRTRALHLIARGGGAIMLGELACALLRPPRPCRPQTVSLLAPACTFAVLEEKLAFSGLCDGAIYTLSAADEKTPDPALGGYGKSPLWLVSRAFEAAEDTALAGILEHHHGRKPGLKVIAAAPGSPDCRARRHDGFDRDPFTMNHILRRITGDRALNDGNGAFRLAETGAGDDV